MKCTAVIRPRAIGCGRSAVQHPVHDQVVDVADRTGQLGGSVTLGMSVLRHPLTTIRSASPAAAIIH